MNDMTDEATCRNVREAVDEAGEASIPAPLAAHVAACAACGEFLRRQARLVAMLSALPAAPRAEFAPPTLPSARGGRLLPFGLPAWTAAAAALLCAVVVWRVSAGGVERVRVVGVVDVAGAPPQVDERLLALTGGMEAVAMRRPTEIR